MRLLDIRPEYINEELARKICINRELKREYIRKYELDGDTITTLNYEPKT